MITTREFSKMCRQRGFSQKGKVFLRCVGDGILQIITTSGREYIWPTSPEYSSDHRKSNYIGIDMCSMYSVVPSYFYQFEEHIARYRPDYILGERGAFFMGIQHEYQIMMEKGFDFLDSIKTQQQLLDAILSWEVIQSSRPGIPGEPIFNNTRLCAPFLICGDYLSALHRLCGAGFYAWSHFLDNNKALRTPEKMELYLQKELEFEREMQESVELINPILGRNKEKLKFLLGSYFQNNFSLAKENGVCFSDDFHPVDLNEIFAEDSPTVNFYL